MTSLSQQLKRLALPQTKSLRLEAKRASFLFDPKEAAGIDRETFFDIGCSGFDELQTIDCAFSQYKSVFFEETSREIQRAMLSKEANENLNNSIEKFLLKLTPFFTLRAAHKTLEWLIYRFSIHQYNIDAVMRCILPYHDTNLFVRMLQTLDIDESNQLWYWLLPLRKSGATLSRQTILNHCSSNAGFVNYVCDMVGKAVDILNEVELKKVQILFTFYASIICGTIGSSASIKESFVGNLLPNLILGVKSRIQEYNISSFMIICQLALKIKLTTNACRALIKQMLIKMRPKTSTQNLTAVVVLFQTQVIEEIEQKAMLKLAMNDNVHVEFFSNLENLCEKTNVDSFLTIFIRSLINASILEQRHDEKMALVLFLRRLISITKLTPTVAQTVFECLIENYLRMFSTNDAKLLMQFQNCFGEICAAMFRGHPAVFDVFIARQKVENDNALRKFIELCDSGVHKRMDLTDTSLTLSLNHVNARIRCLALKQLLKHADTLSEAKRKENTREIAELILERFDDTDWRVLNVLAEKLEVVSKFCEPVEILNKMFKILETPESLIKKINKIKSIVIEKLCALNADTLEDLYRRKLLTVFLPKLFINQSKFCPYANMIAESSICRHFKLSIHLKNYVNKLKETEVKDFNTVNLSLLSCLTAWISENVEERIIFCNEMESSSHVFDSMFASSLYTTLLNTATLPTDILNLIARHLEFCINKFIVIDGPSSLPKMITNQADLVHVISAFVHGSAVPRQFVLYLQKNLLDFYWRMKPSSFRDTKWWSIDDSQPVVKHLIRYVQFLFDGLVSSGRSNAQGIYTPCLEAFLQTYFINLGDLFKLAAVCFTNFTLENLSVSLANLLHAMITSVKSKIIDMFFAKDSVVVPALLIGLSSENSRIRKLTCSCLKALAAASTTIDNQSAYYLEIIHFLSKYAEEIENDASQLDKVLTSFLNHGTAESSKKSTKMSTSILLSILDQFLDVGSIDSVSILSAGLKILRFFNNKDVLYRCAETLKHILLADQLAKKLGDNQIFAEFLSLLISKLCSVEIAEFIGLSSKPYDTLKKLLSSYQDIKSDQLTLITLNELDGPFFSQLPKNVQQDLFKTLTCVILNCPHIYADTVGYLAKSKLSKVTISADILLSYLNEVIFAERTSPSVLSPTRAKRKKTESGSSIDTKELVPKLSQEKLKLLTIFLEIFVNNDNAERADTLIQPLFTSISIYLDVSDREILEYGIRLCLASTESICKKLENYAVTQKYFDVELLVRCIRTAENPQTHQHAFELLTVVASIFKEDLVVRLMPIFSFMGDSLFRQDDVYSFQLIRRTVDTVIPALLLSYDNKQRDDILVKIFREFTASAMHVPQHRRLAILTNLVQSSEKTRNNIVGRQITVIVNQPDNNVVDRTSITCKNLWILVGLLVEYHLLNWNKEQLDAADQKIDLSNAASNSVIEFALRLCAEFSAVDLIYCATHLLKYIMSLPDETKCIEAVWSQCVMPQVFEMKNKNDKHLRHFKYEILGVVSQLLTDPSFIANLSEFTENDFESLSSLCQSLVEEIMKNFHHFSLQSTQKSNEMLSKFWKAMLHRAKTCLDKFNILLPADISLNVIRLLIQTEAVNVKFCALEILNSKLLQNPIPFRKQHVDRLRSITNELTNTLNGSFDNNEKLLLCQNALYSLKLLVRVISVFNKEAFSETFGRVVAIIHDWRSVNKLLLSNALLCLADLIIGLGVLCLSRLPMFVTDLLEILLDKDFSSEKELLTASCLTTLHKIVETMPNFLSPYLPKILYAVGRCFVESSDSLRIKSDIKSRADSIKKTLSSLQTRIILPVVQTVLREDSEERTKDFYLFIIGILHENITHASSSNVTEHIDELTAFFEFTLDFRRKLSSTTIEDISIVEDSVLNVFSLLALKLSENNFRPILFKFIEWAYNDSSQPDRLITLFKLANKLAETLRSLFALFAVPFIRISAELVPKCSLSKKSEKLFTDSFCHEKTNILVRLLFDLINKCCQFDTQGFINRDRFDILMKPLVDQIENIALKDYVDRAENHLLPCLVNLARTVNDDSAWKTLNYEILLKTRNRRSKVRVMALNVVEQLYVSLGESISVLIPETVPFLAELMEDESEEVEQQCQKIIAVLEKIVGESLKDYF